MTSDRSMLDVAGRNGNDNVVRLCPCLAGRRCRGSILHRPGLPSRMAGSAQGRQVANLEPEGGSGNGSSYVYLQAIHPKNCRDGLNGNLLSDWHSCAD